MGAMREARRREEYYTNRYGLRIPDDPLPGLVAIRDRLAALEDERRALVAARPALVERARAGGASWADVSAAAGVSRTALTT